MYTDQNLAGIWLEAGAAIAMMITSTVFLPRYMALGSVGFCFFFFSDQKIREGVKDHRLKGEDFFRDGMMRVGR